MNNNTTLKTNELPIVMHTSILHKIRDYFADKKPDDAAETYYLYSWLYETARYQNNIQVWANDVFLKKKLRFGGDKLHSLQNRLSPLYVPDQIAHYL